MTRFETKPSAPVFRESAEPSARAEPDSTAIGPRLGGRQVGMPPLRTGFSNVDAGDDFRRARRQAAFGRLSRVLTREHGDINLILPFDEVVAALGRTGERDLGLQVVELDTIAGTVDRRTGFDRSFRPTSSRVRTRWERVAAATGRGASPAPRRVLRGRGAPLWP